MISENLTVALGERSYDIYFGPDIYPFFQEWICRFYPGGSVFVITDRNVASIYVEDIRRWLNGIPNAILALPPGEEGKNGDTVRDIYAFLAKGNVDRDSLVVAFGGGVVGDMAGFAAATYLRGIPFVQVPTTLLSQVDSSVGGKTGYNLPEGKNLVGAFHQPRAVFIDPTFLRTLDDRNMRSGLAEVAKCALAGDAGLWETLRREGGRWKELDGSAWQRITRRAVAFKARVVERDEKEASIRRVLNLGHTVGHAFEQAGGYGRWLHGEAVAMGLCWEAILARRLNVTPPEVEEQLFSFLLEAGYRLDDPDIALTQMATAIAQDKKRVVSDVVLPMVTAPGAFVMRRVSLSLIRKELPGIRAEIRERCGGVAAGAAGDRELLLRVEREPGEAVALIEAQVAARPHDLPLMAILAEAYRRAGKGAAAWETIKEVLARNPRDIHAQRLARVIERDLEAAGPADAGPGCALEGTLVTDEGTFELRPVDLATPEAEDLPAAEPPPEPAPSLEPPVVAEACPEPPAADVAEPAPEATPEAVPEAADGEAESSYDATDDEEEGGAAEPPVRTVTVANLYWEQGDRETARRIVDEILAADPADERAMVWKESHADGAGEEDAAEGRLRAFLGRIAEEYGYGLSGRH